jgi:glutamyl-tRNA synthetase
MKSENSIVVRMAPSPTGILHVGSVRTTLFNYLFAKRYGGKFILRSEDTDKERSKKEYEDNILEGLKWLGLSYDEFYRQSERTNIYVSYIKKMIDNGTAYVSKEEVKEEGQRSEVIRFKNPNVRIEFDDLIRGRVSFDTTDLGDFVIARSMEEPLYHLAVVVDDHEMGVTHVLRGEEHISNTPRQILIQEAIGAKRPIYGHMSLILDSDRKKLSKRKHGAAVWIDTYKEAGYLPEALLNYFAFLGWNPGTEQEIFSLSELEKAFNVEQLQKAGAIFDTKKLRWVNKEHIKLLPWEGLKKIISDKIVERFEGAEVGDALIEVIKERIETFGDIERLIEEGELDYFFSEPALDPSKIAWKTDDAAMTKANLEKVKGLIENGEDVMPYAEEAGKGSVLWPLRYSLSGREKSPDPFTLMKILGKDKTLERIGRAIELL